jgi:hypothetical protein
MTKTEILVPMVHMNGTGKQDLMNAIEEAYTALGVAYDKLRLTVPNGRDFYPYGPEAIKRAVEEHRSRMVRIDDIRNELEAIVGGIDDREQFVTVERG